MTRSRHIQAPRRPWAAWELGALQLLYPDVSTERISAAFGRRVHIIYRAAHQMGLRKSPEYISENCRLGRDDSAGVRYRFEKGHVPANKGLRRPGFAPGRMAETQFKSGARSGQAARNWMPIGSTRLCDGYLYRKVSSVPGPWTSNWKLEHRLIWEKATGRKVNWRTHALVFKDGDRARVELENLELITRKELRYRNSIHNLPEPLKEVIRLKGAINRVITCRERKTQGGEKQA